MSLSIGILAGICVMLMWGLNDFLQAIVLKKIGTKKTMFFTELVICIITVVVFFFYFGLGKIRIGLWDALLLFAAEVIAFVGIYNLLRAFEIGEVSIVAPITSSYPFVTAILAYFFLQEQLGLIRAFSIGLIIAGIVLTSSDLSKLRHVHTVKGVREAMISFTSFGLYYFVLGFIKKDMDFMNIFIFTNFLFCLIALPYLLFTGGAVSRKDLKKSGMLFLMIVVSLLAILSWLVFNFALSLELTSVVITISSLYPVITILLAVIFFKDKIVFNQKVGIAATLIGLALISF